MKKKISNAPLNVHPNSPKSDIRALFQWFSPYRMPLLFAALLMGISASSTALYAYLVGPMIKTLFLGGVRPMIPYVPVPDGFLDRIAHGVSAMNPQMVGMAIVGAAILKAAAFFGHSAISQAVGQKMLHDLRVRLFNGLLSQNPLDPKTTDAGDLTVKFTLDTQQIEEAVTKGVAAYFHSAVEIVALSALALSLDLKLGLLGLIAFPPSAVLILSLGRKIRARRAKAHQAAGALGTAVGETAAGLPTIHAFFAEDVVRRRFEVKSLTSARSVTRAALLRAMGSPLNEILGATALAVTLVWAAGRTVNNDLAPESFISFFSALFLLYRPVKGIGLAHHAVESGIAAMSRLSGLLEAQGGIRPGEDVPEPGCPVPAAIELREVETGYGGSAILTNIRVLIQPGERVAVVGPSGAGKTTLLNLLLGLLPIQKGTFLIGGRPFQDSDRRLFAPVRQEPFLFDGSIVENVRIGRSDATLEQIEAACRSAGVMEFARSMEQGVRSPVGPFGQFLSVGQRQRVCLARAIVSVAPVLLLDEVTGAVDGETEQSIAEGLREQPPDRTIIVITHRRSTAEWADRLILIDNGRVAADGPSRELLSTDPRLITLFGSNDA
jgi:subfamily B ATP-binding cassette protein MsbA